MPKQQKRSNFAAMDDNVTTDSCAYDIKTCRKQLDEALSQNACLKRELRLMKLRHQVTPHFLFNSISVAVGLVMTAPKTAASFLRLTASMYRYLLDYGDEYTVPIEQELEMTRQYFRLMSIRHVGCLGLHISKEAAKLKGYPLPPLSLQGLVENAIKHNAHTKEHQLEINIDTDGKWLSVSNNIMPLTSDSGSTKKGLAYMDETMKLLFDRNITVANTGSRFTVSLPLIDKDNNTTTPAT